ncbi:PPOX class F420-dependent oxidoreductase [Kribbella sp. NBC_00382]|uniref:PPOX class F420-dependent oxidoreductase n=1 Tax=Kribbella sp. NBC_00382 TaxID=2975967 RepID=UPI002E22107B
MEIPVAFHELLDSTAVAFVSTLGKQGEPQTTPLWFLWDGGAVHISLVEGRQKLRNLRRDPRITLVVVDPARPTHYIELRGTITDLTPDPALKLERAIAEKYTGDWTDIEPPGTPRYATTIRPAKFTTQLDPPPN